MGTGDNASNQALWPKGLESKRVWQISLIGQEFLRKRLETRSAGVKLVPESPWARRVALLSKYMPA